MVARNKITTDDFAPQHFRPHGRVEFSVLENILICEAIGPFNSELVSAVATVQIPLIDDLARQGIWGDIVIFKKNAMASPEAVSSFSEYLHELSSSGRVPTATALVLPAETEGSTIMRARYLKCYEGARVNLATFERYNEALEWVKNNILVN